MVLLTVTEYRFEIENDVQEMREKGYTNSQIVDFMYELKQELERKIKELE